MEVTLSSLRLASRTATTLSVTWSAGYPKCYSFTVSHSTQDGSINVTQPADSDTSHTLTSLQPGTTYRIEVEAVRKGDRAGRQRAKAVESFTTECIEMFVTEPVRFCQSGNLLSLCTTSHAPNFIHNCGTSGTFSTPTGTALPPRPTAFSETTGEPTLYTSTRQALAAIYTTVMHSYVFSIASQRSTNVHSMS